MQGLIFIFLLCAPSPTVSTARCLCQSVGCPGVFPPSPRTVGLLILNYKIALLSGMFLKETPTSTGTFSLHVELSLQAQSRSPRHTSYASVIRTVAGIQTQTDEIVKPFYFKFSRK